MIMLDVAPEAANRLDISLKSMIKIQIVCAWCEVYR